MSKEHDDTYRMYPAKDKCEECFGHPVLVLTCAACNGTGRKVKETDDENS